MEYNRFNVAFVMADWLHQLSQVVTKKTHQFQSTFGIALQLAYFIDTNKGDMSLNNTKRKLIFSFSYDHEHY